MYLQLPNPRLPTTNSIKGFVLVIYKNEGYGNRWCRAMIRETQRELSLAGLNGWVKGLPEHVL